MIARMVEAALLGAVATAIALGCAVAAGWASLAHAVALVGFVAAAGAILSGLQHRTGLTVLAPVEPPEEAAQ
jgi:phosphate/sulfate permease